MQTAPATISLNLDLTTPEGCALFARVAAALGVSLPPEPGAAVPVAETAKPATGRKGKPAADVVAAEPAPAACVLAAPAPVVADPEPPADETMAQEAAREAAAAPPPFDRDAAVADVKASVNAHVSKHGIPATSAIFKQFAAERLGDVKDGDIAGLKAALETSLAKPAAAADLTS